MQIADKMVVTLDYTLTDNAGNVIDKTDGSGDFAYLHGAGNIIPGLESELAGQAVGASLQVTVSPENGYGPRHDELKQDVPRAAFEGVESIEPGMQFQVQGPNGEAHIVVVTNVTDEQITVDGNHPLAGMELNFDVTIVDIREASEEELTHGHVHGPGHAHH